MLEDVTRVVVFFLNNGNQNFIKNILQ